MIDLSALAAGTALRIVVHPPASVDDHDLLAAMAGGELPRELLDLYDEHAAVELGPVRVLGPGFAFGSPLDAVCATLRAREMVDQNSSGLGVPTEGAFVGIEQLPGGGLTVMYRDGGRWCVRLLRHGRSADSPWPSLREYLAWRIGEEDKRARAAVRDVNRRVREIRAERATNERGVVESVIPAHRWRVNRFCIQDEILAAWEVRFSRRTGCTEVGAVACDSVDQAPIHAGAMAALAALVVETYRNAGSMTMQSTRGDMPTALFRAAEDLGVALRSGSAVERDEVYELLVCCAGVADVLSGLDIPADVRGSIGFQVLQGVWSRDELLVLASFGDEALPILAGGTPSPDVLRRAVEVDLTASAILGGMALRALTNLDENGDYEDARIETETAPWPASSGVEVKPISEPIRIPPGWTALGAAKEDRQGEVLAAVGSRVVLHPRAVTLVSPVDVDRMQQGVKDDERAVLVLPVDAMLTSSVPPVSAIRAPVSLPGLWRQADRRLRKLRQLQA